MTGKPTKTFLRWRKSVKWKNYKSKKHQSPVFDLPLFASLFVLPPPIFLDSINLQFFLHSFWFFSFNTWKHRRLSFPVLEQKKPKPKKEQNDKIKIKIQIFGSFFFSFVHGVTNRVHSYEWFNSFYSSGKHNTHVKYV